MTPTNTPAGRTFALSRGAELERSEHLLVLGATPESGVLRRGLSTRPAREADLPALEALLAASFGSAPPGHSLRRNVPTTQVIELDGVPVGTRRL